jgi:hypothetical protein
LGCWSDFRLTDKTGPRVDLPPHYSKRFFRINLILQILCSCSPEWARAIPGSASANEVRSDLCRFEAAWFETGLHEAGRVEAGRIGAGGTGRRFAADRCRIRPRFFSLS